VALGRAVLASPLSGPLAERILDAWKAHGAGLVVGIAGPQGCGKSTTVIALRQLLEARGLRVAVLSLDDLYLTRPDRLALAAQVHPLLATRGAPGTHEVALGLDLLDALVAGRDARLPRFDKAADTRLDPSCWEAVEGPVDVVLFEGWCVGAVPQDPASLVEPVNALERDEDPTAVWRGWVNTALAGSYQDLFARLDLRIQFRAPDFETVVIWRIEQERNLRERLVREGLESGRTMNDAEVRRFVQHYERLTGHMARTAPREGEMVIRLAADRQPLAGWVDVAGTSRGTASH
jgi:D-glycerate 3-kinase